MADSAEPRRVRLLCNDDAAADDRLVAAVRLMERDGHAIEMIKLTQAGEAMRLAEQSGGEGYDTVVACGGDGTLNEVVNGIVKAGDEPDATSAIGLIPYGTGNDFACGAGISATDPAAALGLIFNEPARPIDVGRLNDRCFVNLATGGFVAEVTTDTPDLLKDALGGPAYTLAGAVMLIGGASRPARVTADGLSFDDNLLLVAIGNGRFAGGGFCLTPDALIDDGLLDVIVIERMSGPMLVQLLQDLRGECHLDREDVHHVQVRRLVVEAPEPLQINLDGEPMTDTRFTAHVLPAAVRMHLPGGCPMLSQ